MRRRAAYGARGAIHTFLVFHLLVPLCAATEPQLGSPATSQMADDPNQPWKHVLAGEEKDRVEQLEREIERLQQEGKFGEAILLAEEAAATRARVQGAEHWEVRCALAQVTYLRRVVTLPDATQAELAQAERFVREARTQRERDALADAESSCRKALTIRENALGGDHEVVAESLNELALMYAEQGNHAGAEPLYHRALGIWQRVFGPDDPGIADILHNLASVYLQRGNYSEAQGLTRRSLAIREKVLGPEHRDTAQSLNHLALIYHHQGKYSDAEPVYERARAIRERVHGPEHADVAESLTNLGGLYGDQGRYAEAEGLLRQALAVLEKTADPHTLSVAVALNNLAGICAIEGKSAEAEQAQKRALEMWEKTVGPDHPNVAAGLINLAGLFLGEGKYAEGEVVIRRAVGILEKVVGLDNQYAVAGLTVLGAFCQRQGRHAEAERVYQQCVGIGERALGLDHPRVLDSLHCLGMVYFEQSRYAEARPLLERALALREKSLGTSHIDVAWSLDCLAALHHAQGAYDEAEGLAQRAVAIHSAALGADHPDVARSLDNLGCLYTQAARYEDAERSLNRALAIREKTLGANHRDVAASLLHLGTLHWQYGEFAQARPCYARALEIVEQQRVQVVGREQERAAFAGVLRLGDIGAGLANVLLRLGQSGAALAALERARNRPLLDLLARSDRDLMEAVRQTGSEETGRQLEKLLANEDIARVDSTTAEATLVAMRKRSDLPEDEKLQSISGQEKRVQEARQAQLDAERAVLASLRNVWPDAKPLDEVAVQAGLEPGELLLSYSWTPEAVMLLVAQGVNTQENSADRSAVRGFFLAEGKDAVERLSEQTARIRTKLTQRPATRELLPQEDLASLSAKLLPDDVRRLVQTAKRVVVLPDGPLHAISFEALTLPTEPRVPARADLLLDAGPQIVYSPSGTVYINRRDQHRRHHEPEKRGEEQIAAPTAVVLGDPLFDHTRPPAPRFPEQGVLVALAEPDGAAAKAGLTRGDVLMVYDGHDIQDYEAFVARWTEVNRQLNAGERPAGDALAVEYWRDGEIKEITLPPGRLGLQLDKAPPRVGLELLARRSRGEPEQVAEVSATDQVRLHGGTLQPLPGSKREATVIADLVQAKGGSAAMLLRDKATIRELEAAVQGKRFIHLATHGLTGSIERPYDASLALTQPETPTPDDIGFLTLDHLIRNWRGKLKDCDLVVLSACDTQRGVKVGDSVMALPWGFFYAGAPTIVASLWKVDDAATALLMERFYEDLLGTRDGPPLAKAEALWEAKRWLRSLKAGDVRRLLKVEDDAEWAALVRGVRGFDIDEMVTAPPSVQADERLFEHPFYWAAFILIGDPG